MKVQLADTVKQLAEYRKEIATLKREVASLNKKLGTPGKPAAGRPASVKVADSEGSVQSAVKGISGKRIASKRKALKVSASDFAKLVGASMQSVYFWEQGRTKPRAAQLAKLHEIMGIGKREALRRLEEGE